jgi:hypothetical protein
MITNNPARLCTPDEDGQQHWLIWWASPADGRHNERGLLASWARRLLHHLGGLIALELEHHAAQRDQLRASGQDLLLGRLQHAPGRQHPGPRGRPASPDGPRPRPSRPTGDTTDGTY